MYYVLSCKIFTYSILYVVVFRVWKVPNCPIHCSRMPPSYIPLIHASSFTLQISDINLIFCIYAAGNVQQEEKKRTTLLVIISNSNNILKHLLPRHGLKFQ